MREAAAARNSATQKAKVGRSSSSSCLIYCVANWDSVSFVLRPVDNVAPPEQRLKNEIFSALTVLLLTDIYI